MFIPPHISELKQEYGFNPALLIDTLSYFTADNMISGKGVIDGKIWVRLEGGYNKISELIPILTPRQIGYAVNKMVQEDILEVNDRILNKFGSDRTYSYCLNYKRFEKLILKEATKIKKKKGDHTPTPAVDGTPPPAKQPKKTPVPAPAPADTSKNYAQIKADMAKIDQDFIQLAQKNNIDENQLLKIGQTAFNTHYNRKFNKNYDLFHLTNYGIKGILGQIIGKMTEEKVHVSPFNLLIKSEWYFWAAYRNKGITENPSKFSPPYLNNTKVFDGIYKQSVNLHNQNSNPQNQAKRRIDFNNEYKALFKSLKNDVTNQKDSS